MHAVERDLTLEPLIKACVAALKHVGSPGSGIKALRLVSKHVSQALTRKIQGYTLVLDGIPKDLPKVSLLKLTQLTCLRVVVIADPKTQRLGLSHLIQVQEFMAAIGPALRTVTTFDVRLPEERFELFEGSGEETAALLSPLVDACSSVQLLKIRGDVGSPLLAAFRASCHSLTSLEAQDVPRSTLEALSQLLPDVTSTRMSLVGDEYEDEDKPAYFHEAIMSCPTLVQLDTGGHGLVGEIWKLLPSCLQELIFGEHLESDDGEDEVDTDGFDTNLEIPQDLLLPNLRDIRYLGSHIPLCLLASLLRIAPNLQRIAINDVWMPCSPDQIPDLVLVHTRLCAGLVVSNDPEEMLDIPRAQGRGIVLVLQDLVDADPASPASLFVLGLPVFEQFMSIKLQAVGQPLLSGLASAFPRLRYMRIPDSSLPGSSWLPSLTAFPSLQVLDLAWREVKFSLLELGVLCIKVPSLRYLLVELSPTDRQSLIDVLGTWGRRVVVQSAHSSFDLQ